MTDTAEKIILKMPKLGESIQEATVLEWLKKEGDPVKRDEPLLEVTTDKVNSEIPASISGFIVEIYAKPGEVVEVGAPLCALSSEQVVAEKISSSPQASAPPVSYSPAVLRLAGERGIPLEEIALITGTGEGGRITKRDIEAYNFAAPHYAPPLNCASSRQKAEQISGDMLPLSPLRKIIADRMVQSVREIPHAALVSEVDMGEVMQEIGRKKEALWKAEGVKLTPTSFVIEAIAYALKFYPHLNASLVGETIVLKKEIHVGVAVSKNDGVLVPVIPQVEKKDVI